MTTNGSEYDERVLICAPMGRDAALIQQTLNRASITAEVCSDVGQVCREIVAGAAALSLTQEALSPPGVEHLLDALGEQPSWSDLPIVVLVSRGPSMPTNSMLAAQLAPKANVTFLERPVSVTTLVSATQAALRTRHRQYEFRDLLSAHLQAEEAER